MMQPTRRPTAACVRTSASTTGRSRGARRIAGPTARVSPSTWASTSSTSRSAKAWARASAARRPQPDVLNYSWREYGNRVGVWRCLELFDAARPADRRADQYGAVRPLPRGDRRVRRARRRTHRARPSERASARANGRRRANARCSRTAATASPRAPATRQRAGCRRGSPRATSRPICSPRPATLHAQLVPRRPAHADAHALRPDALVDSLPAGAERHSDDRGAPDGRGRVRADDRRPVRRDAAAGARSSRW